MTVTHEPYKRILPEADTAVLFIHGIVGTPNHFRDLIGLEAMVPENWSVHNILLEGHGGSVEDFSASSMKKWKAGVQSAFEELARTHDRVMVVGHSMGTLFALQLGVEFPDKIPQLFLLAVPLRPGVRLRMAWDCLRMAFGKLPEDHVLWKAAGVTTTRKVWKYLGWIPQFLELFREISHTESILKDLKVPCVAYQSQKDELVRNSAGKVLERSGTMEVRHLDNSTHYYYALEERQRVQQDFANCIIKISHD